MPYTRSWDETEPDGSEAASNIDNLMRDEKVDLRERFETTLVDDMTADPIVALPAISGAGAHKLYLSAFTFVSTQNDLDSTSSYQEDTGSGGIFRASVPLTAGCVITRIRWLVNPTGDVLSCKLYYVDFDTAAALTNVASGFTSSASAITIIDSGILVSPHTVLDLALYTTEIVVGSGGRVYGVEISYTVADSTQLRG